MILGDYMERVRKAAPVILNITNYVTARECANIIIAAGASPIMSDDPREMKELVGLASGVNINIGTLNFRSSVGIGLAHREAGKAGKPVVLDPVGAGASSLRTKTAARIANSGDIALIRSNVSEMRALCGDKSNSRGVDAGADDAISGENLKAVLKAVVSLSEKTGAVVSVSGETDIITDGKRAYLVRNGTPLMPKTTGSGCMLSALTSAYIAASPGETLEAALAATCAMGICGERAEKASKAFPGSYGISMTDELSRLSPEELCAEANFMTLTVSEALNED